MHHHGISLLEHIQGEQTIPIPIPIPIPTSQQSQSKLIKNGFRYGFGLDLDLRCHIDAAEGVVQCSLLIYAQFPIKLQSQICLHALVAPVTPIELELELRLEVELVWLTENCQRSTEWKTV